LCYLAIKRSSERKVLLVGEPARRPTEGTVFSGQINRVRSTINKKEKGATINGKFYSALSAILSNSEIGILLVCSGLPVLKT